MMSTGHSKFILISLAILNFVFLNGCRQEQSATPSQAKLAAVPVQVSTARLEKVPNQIELLGTLQAVNRAEIAAKISGSISKIPVVLGSEVKKGDLLVEISAGEIAAKVQQSRAQYEQARRNLDREMKLLQKNAATQEAVKSLQENYRIAEATYQEALSYQDYTRVVAPFSGRVTKKMANTGDLATPGKPLLYLEDESRLQVLIDLPEAMVLRIVAGDVASITIPAANLTVPGTVSEVAPSADPASRTASVKLNIDAHSSLRSGQFARVNLAQLSAETITIPTAAILPYGQLERVFVVKDGTARLRLVKSGAPYGNNREILAGIASGEQVVVGGQQHLRDGQAVTLQ